MTGDIAERLLEAQVQWIISEVSGDRLAQVIERDTVDVYALADTMIVGEVVDKAAVKASALVVIDVIQKNPVSESVVEALADAIYDLSANEKYHLGDVISREPVKQLVTKILGMHTMFEKGLERFTESPVVATVASHFVNRIVTDFAEQSREKAEKIPGMKGLLAFGDKTVGKVMSAGDRAFGQVIGDATASAAQYALRRTNNAILGVIENSPVEEGAMELWDLFAKEPVGDLRQFLSREDLRELAVIGYELITTTKNHEYLAELVDEVVEVIFAHYGEYTITQLVTELGFTADVMRQEITRFAPAVVEAAKRNGALEAHVRSRLAPFFSSDAVQEILA